MTAIRTMPLETLVDHGRWTVQWLPNPKGGPTPCQLSDHQQMQQRSFMCPSNKEEDIAATAHALIRAINARSGQ